MISASLPGEALGQLGPLSHAYPGVPPPPAMTPEFLAPRPYARYPPRAARPRDPPAPSYPAAPTAAYPRFLQHPVPYHQYLCRSQLGPGPQLGPPFPLRPRPTSGFVPPAPAPRSPPAPAPAPAPEPPPPPPSPAHFCRGALIRLQDGTLRRVEDMRTEDFASSADRCADLAMTNCRLLNMEERGDQLSLILAYDKNRSQVELESTVDHPFFVYGCGWASYCPERTLRRYGLRVRQLSVGDVCVSMMERRASPAPAPPPAPALLPAPAPPPAPAPAPAPATYAAPAPPQTYPENLSVKEDARKRRWSAPDACDDDRPPLKKR